MDNVAGWILELDRGEGFPFEGNYTGFLEKKMARLASEAKVDAKRKKSLEKELEASGRSCRLCTIIKVGFLVICGLVKSPPGDTGERVVSIDTCLLPFFRALVSGLCMPMTSPGLELAQGTNSSPSTVPVTLYDCLDVSFIVAMRRQRRKHLSRCTV